MTVITKRAKGYIQAITRLGKSRKRIDGLTERYDRPTVWGKKRAKYVVSYIETGAERRQQDRRLSCRQAMKIKKVRDTKVERDTR